MRKSIIVDIDGTLADCDHRLHHIRNLEDDGSGTDMTFKADWDAFYDNALEDTPIVPTCDLVRTLIDASWSIILITGRSGKYRKVTEAWLREHEIYYDLLLMREPGDHTKDDEIKRDWLRQLRNGQIGLENTAPPELALEDRDRVVKMWREEGIICLQCDYGEF